MKIGPLEIDDLEYEDEEERDCLICCGDGYLYGEDMGDPLWYDSDVIYPCYSCGGSGFRKDMTVW